MDCDEIETEATKNMKEKTADEMLEELGYEKKIGEIYKHKRKCVDIYFIRPNELIEIEFYGDNRNYFCMKELQAINKKCEELGLI